MGFFKGLKETSATEINSIENSSEKEGILEEQENAFWDQGLEEADALEGDFMETEFTETNFAESDFEESDSVEPDSVEPDSTEEDRIEEYIEEDGQMFYEDDQMVNTLEEADEEALYGAEEEGLYEEELPDEEYSLEEGYPDEEYPEEGYEEMPEEAYETEEYEPDEAAFEEGGEAKADVTVITKGTIINGSIISDGSLEVNGQVNGDIECLGKLTILGNVTGDTSASEVYVNAPRVQGGIKSKGSVKVGVGTVVIGDISGTSSVIAGAVKGNIDVTGPVIVDSTAVIKGDIKARAVQVNNGAVLEGFYSLGYSEVDIDSFFESEE